ncbi:MAG: L-threonylcarbamoyladenylate synthase [Vampirovibrionales bacterium]|nr:L-threonylcarbamoyladenylate synthase [Vampirovibrionales bacterium]
MEDKRLAIKQDEISAAVSLLKQGKLVAMPTETVYGLAADAKNPVAVKRLYDVKGRPGNHPVIVHLPSSNQLAGWARDIPEVAWCLAEAFWPGPMTLILKKKPDVSDAITGAQDTVGLRVPAHPMAQALLNAYGSALVAPSANRFGHVSPTTAAHVREDLGQDVSLVLDGGECPVGVESTIIDCSQVYSDDQGDIHGKPRGNIRVLRPGMLLPAEIQAVLVRAGYPDILLKDAFQETTSEIRVSGSLKSHYAPTTPLRLYPFGELRNVWQAIGQKEAKNGKLAVLSFEARPDDFRAENGVWLKASADASQYARTLYANLRALDKPGASAILVELPQTHHKERGHEDWRAVLDRLQRASVPREQC